MGKILRIIIHVGILFIFYYIGFAIQVALHLPISGSVIGMVILFLLLFTNVIKVEWIESGTQFMIKHLTIFYIPASVGFIDYLQLFAGKGIWLIIIVLISTAIVMGGSGLVSQWLIQRKELKHD